MTALAEVLDLDLGADAVIIRDFLRSRGLNDTLAGRIPNALRRCQCRSLREAEERLSRGEQLRAPRVGGWRPPGLGAASERALREVLGLPAEPPARRIVLTLDDGSYFDQSDVEWIRVEELDQEQAS